MSDAGAMQAQGEAAPGAGAGVLLTVLTVVPEAFPRWDWNGMNLIIGKMLDACQRGGLWPLGGTVRFLPDTGEAKRADGFAEGLLVQLVLRARLADARAEPGFAPPRPVPPAPVEADALLDPMPGYVEMLPLRAALLNTLRFEDGFGDGVREQAGDGEREQAA